MKKKSAEKIFADKFIVTPFKGGVEVKWIGVTGSASEYGEGKTEREAWKNLFQKVFAFVDRDHHRVRGARDALLYLLSE